MSSLGSPDARAISALHSGKIDIGFVLQPSDRGVSPVNVDALQTKIVTRHSVGVLLPKNHKLTSRGRIEFSQLANEPYILSKREKGPVFYDYVISLYQRHGLALNVRHEADHPSTVLGLVAAGLGITKHGKSRERRTLRSLAKPTYSRL